jgi:hypothetical protein
VVAKVIQGGLNLKKGVNYLIKNITSCNDRKDIADAILLSDKK